MKWRIWVLLWRCVTGEVNPVRRFLVACKCRESRDPTRCPSDPLCSCRVLALWTVPAVLRCWTLKMGWIDSCYMELKEEAMHKQLGDAWTLQQWNSMPSVWWLPMQITTHYSILPHFLLTRDLQRRRRSLWSCRGCPGGHWNSPYDAALLGIHVE